MKKSKNNNNRLLDNLPVEHLIQGKINSLLQDGNVFLFLYFLFPNKEPEFFDEPISLESFFKKITDHKIYLDIFKNQNAQFYMDASSELNKNNISSACSHLNKLLQFTFDLTMAPRKLFYPDMLASDFFLLINAISKYTPTPKLHYQVRIYKENFEKYLKNERKNLE